MKENHSSAQKQTLRTRPVLQMLFEFWMWKANTLNLSKIIRKMSAKEFNFSKVVNF